MPTIDDSGHSKGITDEALTQEEAFSMKPPADEPFPTSDQLSAWTRNVEAAHDPGELDVAAFVKAQSAFIAAQMRFMSGRSANVHEAQDKLTNFSLAQGEFIAAQNAVLAQLGVV